MIWLAMLVLWELQIVVAVVDKHAHVEKLSSHQFWRFFHYGVSAALLLFGPFQMQWLAPDAWKQRCRRGPPLLVVAYLIVFVVYLAGPLPKAGAIVAGFVVVACYLLALLVALPGLQPRPEAPPGVVLRQMASDGAQSFLQSFVLLLPPRLIGAPLKLALAQTSVFCGASRRGPRRRRPAAPAQLLQRRRSARAGA